VDNATNQIITNPLRSQGEVAAIITLGDSSYKSEDLAPMVQQTWTNNGIRIYTIQYVSAANGCNTGDSKVAAMATLANATHGIPFCCTNSSQVVEAFDEIKRNLSEIAGVNTVMDLNLENPIVNNDTWSGSEVFDYVVVDDGMTSPDSRTTILWPNNTRSFENQTADWNDDYRLNFTIGTIKIKQSWETTFRFKVKQEGIIDLFGPGSTISYNDMPGSLHLPTTLIESINHTIPTGLTGGTLEIENLAITKSGAITDFVPLRWNLQYKGSATATETMWYSYNNGTWVQFGTVTGIPPTIAPDYLPYTHTAFLDIEKLAPGNYLIKVIAFAPDAPDDEKIVDVGYIGSSGVYIKLE
jgi:hypothetical protein